MSLLLVVLKPRPKLSSGGLNGLEKDVIQCARLRQGRRIGDDSVVKLPVLLELPAFISHVIL